MVEHTCCGCGTKFGIDEPLHHLRKADFLQFYCPNGHAQSYIRPAPVKPKTDIEAMKKELVSLTAERDKLALELAIWKPRDA